MNNDIYRFFSRAEYLKGREVYYPLNEEMEANLIKLMKALNPIREAYGKPLSIVSGYRSPSDNERAGGAKKSNHLMCLACDFKDTDGKFAEWCLTHLDLLEQNGLYMEDPASTKNWIHLQFKKPASGNRVFKP